MIAEAAIHAVHELTVHKRRAVAVWGAVGEQARAPICLIGGNFEAGTRVRRGEAAVGSRLKTVTSVKSSDNKRCLIDFMSFSFPKAQ